MAGEQILLDPTSEATGTELDITDSTLGYFLISHDYPDPDIDVVEAGSIDTEGSIPAAGKYRPRTISVVVRCVQPSGGSPSIGTIVSNLQRKIGKLFREGGTYRRVLPSGDPLTFDVHRFGARINVPADKRWLSRTTVDVTMTFTCQPGGRGSATPVTISPSTATSKQPLIFTATGIKGDLPALGSLRIANATTDKSWLFWGQQSRYYDSDTKAALLLEAEDCQASGAAVNAGPAGASGGGTNKVMRHASVGTSGATAFNLGTSGNQNLTHVGTFRVLARVQADSANTGIAKTQLWWRTGNSGSYTANDWTSIATSAGAAIKGSWVVVDLGQVTLPPARLGSQLWQGPILSASTVGTDTIYYDWIAMIPVDEGAGLVRSGISTVLTTDSVDISDKGILVGHTTWVPPNPGYEGDYLGGNTGVPPAGTEGRTLRMIVLFTGGGSHDYTNLADAVNIDAITATLTVTPRYLSVPAP